MRRRLAPLAAILPAAIASAAAAPEPAGPPPPEVARPDPVRVTVGGAAREVRLDALQRFGATPLPALCAAPRPEEALAALLLDEACAAAGRRGRGGDASRGDAALAVAHRWLGAEEAPKAAREPRLRDANGLVLAGLRLGVTGGQLAALADRYSDLGERARDGTPFAIASELMLAHAAFCAPADARCRGAAETDAADDLVEAGRWSNDVERLRLAGEMAERVERTAPGAVPDRAPARRTGAPSGGARAGAGWPDADGLFQARNIAGSAYSYAAQFAVPAERLPFMQRSVAAYERALPDAEARAPSFSSARLWQNLGAAYQDRGALTGDEADFTRGVTLYERALPLFDPKTDRQALARTRSNMGRARTRMAERARDLALHDRALADQRAALAGFEEAQERLDAAFTRYRLAQDLAARAKTADKIADALGGDGADAPARRADLARTAAESRRDALAQLGEAMPVFVRAGADQFLERAREVEAEVRGAR